MALEELHSNGKIHWPGDARIAVLLSFDFQGGEDVKPDKNGKMNHEEYTQAEYGPKTGIWLAERYPDQVAAIIAQGHEIAGHGYHHEVARDLTKDEERDVIKRTTEMILNRAKKRPSGWRSCTQSPNSLELLLEQGYLWNSNSFSHDLPFVWQSGKKKLVELPRQPFGDGRTYGHRDSGNPNDTLVIWKGMFDQFYEESTIAPTFCPFQFHPYISSRPGRAKTLSDMIGYMKSHKGVWFATGSEVAHWWLEKEFSVERSSERVSKVA